MDHLLVEAAAPEVIGNDDVRHSIKDKLHILGVGGTGHVAVDLLCCRLVFSLKLCLDVSGSLTIFLCA